MIYTNAPDVCASNFRHDAINDGTIPQTIVTMSVVISNIHSITNPHTLLGGVAYSDSFLLSAIKYSMYAYYSTCLSFIVSTV